LNDDADVHQTGLTLAAYRSVLNPSPPIPTHKSELPNTFPTQLAQLKARAFYDHTTVHLFKDDTVLGAGVAIDASSMAPGQEMFVPPSKFVESNNDDFNDLILIGATQTLDGIAWRRVTFVDTHIRYTGGSLILENVTFVNCTFDFPANNVGQQLVRYAVLEPKQELKVG